MSFLEMVEKNKESFLKEEEKKEYENDNAWYPFLINFMEDRLGITFEDYEPTLEDYKSLLF